MSTNKIKSTANPLGLEPKREKSGSYTFQKYNFQYHWAFCRMLDELENGKEFVLFIEEHEDVTVADSLDAEKTTFEFNQIKETSKKHTIHSLTKKTKNDPQSLIEKLANSCCDKSYSEKISRVNFVSTGGYSFELHKDGFSFDVISSDQLSENEGNVVAECIAEIKDTGGFYEKLVFVIPELPEKGFDLVVEGRISSLVSKLAPGLKYDSNAIYSCVIRDLNRKGENSFDYADWDHAIRKKAITHKQLSSVIEQHIGRKPDECIVTELMQILKDDYSFNSITRRSVVRGFNRYYAKKVASREKLLNDVSMDLISNIKELAHKYSSVKDLEAAVVNSLNESTLAFFQTNEDRTGAFLYEFLEGVEV